MTTEPTLPLPSPKRSHDVILSLALLAGMMAMAVYFAVSQGNKETSNQDLPDLATVIPEQFANWQAEPETSFILPAELPEEEGVTTLYRAYRNEAGDRVMMVIVYGAQRGDTMRLHLPEVCYVAQGYDISNRSTTRFTFGPTPIDTVSIIADNGLREESVTYWMRVSDYYARSQIGQQLFFLRADKQQRRDSALVRISVASRDQLYANRVTNRFIHDFVTFLPPPARQLLLVEKEAG
jgi:EpsI family protein